MFKNVVSLFLLLSLLSLTHCGGYRFGLEGIVYKSLGGKPQLIESAEKIEPNPWQVFKVADTLNAYRVSWDQKYGNRITQYCKVVFHNAEQRQYMLVAPWLNSEIIERANINNIEFQKLPIADILDNYALEYKIKSAIIDTVWQ